MDESQKLENLEYMISSQVKDLKGLRTEVENLKKEVSALQSGNLVSEPMLPAVIKSEIVLVSNKLQNQSELFEKKALDIQAEIDELYSRIDLLAETCSQAIQKNSNRIEMLENALLSNKSQVSVWIPPVSQENNANEFIYKKNNNEIAITGYMSLEEKTALVIPQEIENLPVTSIQVGAFTNCNFLQVIQFPESLKIICAGAFLGCKNFRKVYIPPSVQEIGYDFRSSFSKDIVIYCQTNSCVVKWARDKGYPMKPAQEFTLE